MGSLIQCEECKGFISSSGIKVFEKIVKPGIVARIWKCPHCNHSYLVTVMDKTARRMMEANKKDKEKMGNISKIARHQRSTRKLNATQAQQNVKRVEQLEKSIADRTKKLDDRMQGLIKEYRDII